MKFTGKSIATVLGLGIGLGGCSSDSTSDAADEAMPQQEEEQSMTIEREEVPEGRFKPSSLESAVNDMVDSIEASGASNDVALGVVLKDLSGFWRPVTVGANRAIEELGVIGSVKGTTEDGLDVEQAVEEQIEFIQEQMEDGVNGLAISPHNQDVVDALDKFTSETRAPIVTIDGDLEDIDRSIYIGTNNAEAGKTGGETLVDQLEGNSGLVIVLGNTDPAWAGGYDRTTEAVKVLEGAGNTVQVLNSRWVPEDEVAQLLETMGAADEPIVGMLGVFANAFHLATAAQEAELDPMPTIVAFDFEPDTLSYMQDGVIAATHVQRQYYMGYMSVYTLFSINALGLDETKSLLGDLLIDGYHLDTGLDVIRAGDLDEYDSFLDELGI